MIGEVTYFATNSLGIAAAAISIGMAIKTAIDAVTDLLMGAIVDRTHTKWGKARPWASCRHSDVDTDFTCICGAKKPDE